MTDTTYAVLEALACGRPGCACARAVRRGHGLTHCPVHDDRTPSLTVDLKGSRLLWNCRAGCAQAAVLAELQRRGLLHEVRDHAGRLLARHERKGRWLQPDGRIGLNGTSSKDMLYGLERVAAADAGRTVVIVEGEKAAAALHGLDVLAVGTTCGAASTPAPEVLRHLRGRPVVLWPDADEPGLRHMALVADELRRLGAQVLTIEWPQAPEHGDAADFVEQLADQVDDDARRRVVLDFLRTAKPMASPPRAQTVPADVTASTWRPVDLAAVLAGDLTPLEPAIFEREDGVRLLYPGRLHSFIGEPETGKSWAVQLAGAQVLRAGGVLAYVDHESEARDVVGHFLALGVEPQMMAERLIYVRPEEAFDDAARAHLLAAVNGRDVGLAVLDGVDASMTVSGLEPSSRKDYALWHHRLVRPLQLAIPGPLVLVDHVVKDREKRGDWASGAGNKKALIDGALFMFELVQPFGRGRTGSAAISVAKDRPGALRRHCGNGKEIARLELASDEEDTLTVRLLPASPANLQAQDGKQGDGWRPTELMERISTFLERREGPYSQSDIEAAKLGRAQWVRNALDHLVRDGYVGVSTGARNAKLHSSVRPFRQDSDPSSSDPVPPRPDPVRDGVRVTATDPVPPRPHPPSRGDGGTGSVAYPLLDGTESPRLTSRDGVECQHPTTSTVNGVTQCLSCPESWPRPVLMMMTEVDG